MSRYDDIMARIKSGQCYEQINDELGGLDKKTYNVYIKIITGKISAGHRPKIYHWNERWKGRKDEFMSLVYKYRIEWFTFDWIGEKLGVTHEKARNAYYRYIREGK